MGMMSWHIILPLVMMWSINLTLGGPSLEGIADRGTYDLDQHMKHSNKKVNVF